MASSRATSFAALIPAPKDREKSAETRAFITRLSKWSNSLDETLLDQARKNILEANKGLPPRVLDPFAGGGSIPLEALRLGCEVFASDYNPVAALILKCTVQYPQKYGPIAKGSATGIVSETPKNRLLEEVRQWGNWILDRVREELKQFYPADEDGARAVGYIWSRTIPCQNPSCQARIPLMRKYWIAHNRSRKVAFFPSRSNGQITFKIVGTGYEKMPKGFDPERGTVDGAVATCLVCGSMIQDKTTRSLFQTGKAVDRMIGVVVQRPGTEGKFYRLADDRDVSRFRDAEDRLRAKVNDLTKNWGLDAIPDEPLPIERARGFSGFRILLYGMKTWGDLYNSRQKLALLTFADYVRRSHEKMTTQGTSSEFAQAVTTYLAIILDRLADKNSNLVIYNVVGEKIEHVFGRQALGMIWDYVELNPFTPVGWPHMQDWVERAIDHCSQSAATSAEVSQRSSIALPYPNDFFDAVFTDPPYYDNVAYADLSDFFYVLLKRTVGDLHPELFSTMLTPKSEEIIQDPGRRKDKQFFEDKLTKSLKEIFRVLKPNGVAIVVYAHKSTDGWETLINSLLGSGLVVTAAWPIHTERTGRLVARETAALASSIYMVTRKTQREPVGFYKDVKDSLKVHLSQKLDTLWNEGISGGDFFISAIGASIEVFGKYEKIVDDEGNVVRAVGLLEDVRRVATDYAVKQVLHDGIAGQISPMTRFYILWRWAYGEGKLEFDDAHKLAQGVGIKLDQEWEHGFIRKQKEVISALGPQERTTEELNGSNELIDVLHHALLLWERGKREEILTLLRDTGYGKSDVFYRVAQAIAESLSSDSKEKKLLEGFLQGRQRIAEDIRRESDQRKLFE